MLGATGSFQIELGEEGVLDFRLGEEAIVFIGLDGDERRFPRHELSAGHCLEWRVYPECAVLTATYTEAIHVFSRRDRELRELARLDRFDDRGFRTLSLLDLPDGVLVVYEQGLARIGQSGELRWHQLAQLVQAGRFRLQGDRFSYYDDGREVTTTRSLATGEVIG